MQQWAAFAGQRDLDGAMEAVREVHAEDPEVEEAIRWLCNGDWSALAKGDRLALHNLLQHSHLIREPAVRSATVTKALHSDRTAFRLAGAVACQDCELDDAVVARLAEMCAADASDAVVSRAMTSLRGVLEWPRDAAILCRIANARNEAFDDVTGIIVKGSGAAEPERHALHEVVHAQILTQWRAHREAEAAGKTMWLGGMLSYIPNLEEIELSEQFPHVQPGQLAQFAHMFEELARGADTVPSAAVLQWTVGKIEGMTLEDVEAKFGKDVDLEHFVAGVLSL